MCIVPRVVEYNSQTHKRHDPLSVYLKKENFPAMNVIMCSMLKTYLKTAYSYTHKRNDSFNFLALCLYYACIEVKRCFSPPVVMNPSLRQFSRRVKGKSDGWLICTLLRSREIVFYLFIPHVLELLLFLNDHQQAEAPSSSSTAYSRRHGRHDSLETY